MNEKRHKKRKQLPAPDQRQKKRVKHAERVLLNEKKRKKQKKCLREKKTHHLVLRDSMLAVGISLVLLLGIAVFLFRAVRIQGYGMAPTLRHKDLIVVWKTKKLERFDLVAYKNGEKIQVRRVIGLPGEKIEYKEDTLLVDDQSVDEKFLVNQINESQRNGKNYTEDFSVMLLWGISSLPEESYLVLGDNRSYTTDSRDFGLIKQEKIIGVIKVKVSPIHEFTSY